MWKMEKVLIASDNYEGMEWALEKAVYVEHYTGASLDVLKVIYNHIQETPSRLISEEKLAVIGGQLISSEQYVLDTYTKQIEKRIAQVSSSVRWNKNSISEILSHAQDNDIDLIIKPVSKHHRIGDYINAPLDWEIMRYSRCPVMISKDQSWTDNKKLLVALDIADERHALLNKAIVETGVHFASMLDAELHLVSVYPDMGQEVSNYRVAVDFIAVKEDMKRTREKLLEEVVISAELEDAVIHVHAGSPAKVIAQLAEELEPTITIVGTVSRHGAGKLVFGNTSESLIPLLEGDILCVHDVEH